MNCLVGSAFIAGLQSTVCIQCHTQSQNTGKLIQLNVQRPKDKKEHQNTCQEQRQQECVNTAQFLGTIPIHSVQKSSASDQHPA